jgi:hypothetical protein
MPTKANDRYQWDTFEGIGERHIVELAAALVPDTYEMTELALKEMFPEPSLQLFLDSVVSQLGSGDVSSNLRFKHDKGVNNAVVKNTLLFLEFYRKLNTNPVVVTSYPREERVYSFKMKEDGSVTVKNTLSGEGEVDKEVILQEFFKKVDLTTNRRQKMRVSSEGAHHYTYLADLLSLITQVDYYYHQEMFETFYLSPDVVNTSMKKEYGLVEGAPSKYLLTKVEKAGKTWVPKEGFDYLYFTWLKKEGSQTFMKPKEGAIQKVNHQMWELLRSGENGTKKMIREHFMNVRNFKRWSDYSVNDVDDGITMCAIFYAFMYSSSDNEIEFGFKIKGVVDTWYGDLDD